MYLDFFGFIEAPFPLSPDPRFIYFSKPHKEVFTLLLYGLERRYGFIAITGEMGTGKTTVLRTLLTKLDEKKYRFVLIFNPVMTAVDLMKDINREYGIPCEADNCAELLEELNSFLMEEKAADRTVLLIIDEAQNLSSELLEQVRLISNLGTNSEKLIQIILAGQPELGRMLERPELRRLNQRALRYHLNRLDKEDTEGYIKHRLTLAGGDGKVTFSRWALRWLFHISRGTPRLINILCERALLAAYAENRRKITARSMLFSLRAKKIKPAFVTHPKIGKKGAFAIAAAFMVVFGYLFLAHEKKSEDVAPKNALEERQVPQVASKPSGKTEEHGGVPLGKRDIIHLAKTSPRTPVEAPSPPTKSAQLPAEAKIEKKSLPVPPETIGRYPKEKSVSDGFSVQERKTSALQAFNTLAPVMKTAPISRLDESSPIINQLKREAGRRGLEMERFGGGIDETFRFNVPTLLDVSPKGSKDPLFVAITGLHDGEVAIHPSLKGRNSFSRLEMAKLASGRVYILWRNNEKIRLPLSPGDSGNSVIKMQILLQAAGAGSPDVSGVFDEKTGRAVREFQRSKGLKATGKVGPMTMIQLYRTVTEPSSSDALGDNGRGGR